MSIDEYVKLVALYIDDKVYSEVFKDSFIQRFKKETEMFPEKIYFPLGGIFQAADAFDPLGLPDKEEFRRLDEKEFRTEVRRLFQELQEALYGHHDDTR